MHSLSGFSDRTQSHSSWDVLYWFLLFSPTGLLVFTPGVFSLLPDVGHYKPVTPKRLMPVCHEIFLQSQFPASATDVKAPTSSLQMSRAPDLVRQFTNKPGQTNLESSYAKSPGGKCFPHERNSSKALGSCAPELKRHEDVQTQSECVILSLFLVAPALLYLVTAVVRMGKQGAEPRISDLI